MGVRHHLKVNHRRSTDLSAPHPSQFLPVSPSLCSPCSLIPAYGQTDEPNLGWFCSRLSLINGSGLGSISAASSLFHHTHTQSHSSPPDQPCNWWQRANHLQSKCGRERQNKLLLTSLPPFFSLLQSSYLSIFPPPLTVYTPSLSLGVCHIDMKGQGSIVTCSGGSINIWLALMEVVTAR